MKNNKTYGNTTDNARFSSGVFSLTLCALAVIAAVVINLLFSLLPSGVRKLDLSGRGLSELSDTTADFLGALQYDVRIIHICVTGEEDTALCDLLEKYDEYPRVSVETLDPAVHPSFTSEYTDAELDSNSIIVISERRSKVVESLGMYTVKLFYIDDNGNTHSQGEMSYGDFKTFYNSYGSYFGEYYSYDLLFSGEVATTSAIDYVVSDSLPTAYEVTGHGETVLSDRMKSNLSLDNIDLKSLSLSVSGIPEDADCIVINCPLTDFSENEAGLLTAYLEKGGNIFLMSDPEHLALSNLFGVMNKYGLEAGTGYICESSAYVSFPYMIIADSTTGFKTLGISGYSVLTPLSHPIIINENTDCGAVYLKMLKTSEKSYITTSFEDGENDGTADLVKESFNVGVLATLEGSESTSHIMWISSPTFATDEINSYSTGGNYIFLLKLTENLTGKGSSLALVSKETVEPSLVVSSAQAMFWTAVFCIIIPLATLIPGLYIVYKRRRR